MKAVILAAGEGVRLRPLTLTRPKHLIKLGGKPILEHCLNVIKACGIKEVLIIVHYMADSIRQYFQDGKKFGLKIEYKEQKGVLGTGNAASLAESYVDEEAFLLVYGDLLFSAESVKKIIDKYKSGKSAAVMAVVSVEKPENYGVVEFQEEEKVKRIIEKPNREKAPTNLVNAGIYVFSNEIFEKIKGVSASVRGEWEITDAISFLAKERDVSAVKISRDEWIDIGRPWDLLEANRWILNKMEHKVYGQVEEDAHFIGPVTIAKSARIRSGTYIEGPVFVDEGSDLGPNCFIRPFTSIGRNVRIGNACEIKNSVIMDNTHIGHLSYIGDSVIGENCNLGAGTITANLRFDDKPVKMIVKDKVVDTGRRKLGVIMGDNVKTGINALFMPGVKVGKNCWIGPNVVVNKDVPSNTIILLKQNLEYRSFKS